MMKATIAGVVIAIVLIVLFALVGQRILKRALEKAEEPDAGSSPAATLTAAEATEAHEGFIFGLVTARDGTIYEGRLRFGADEEAFWGDYFNGSRKGNPWVAQVPPEQLRKSAPVEIFGFRIFQSQPETDVPRPFMARFGDITRVESNGRDLRVTLKSGTVFDLDLFAADDFADGVRVWDGSRGVVDLTESDIRSIDFRPGSPVVASPRLHGTVRTRWGEFTGFIQWNRAKGLGSDELDVPTAKGEVRLRFDTVRSIARNSRNSALVTLVDGEPIILSGNGEDGIANRGIYVDDRRYGRVLIPWGVVERVEFSPGGSGPSYDDFPAGRPLTGEVTLRDGRRLAGRLVYDLDESETTETLDAPSQFIDYTIFFGLVDSIVLPAPEKRGAERGAGRASVTLHGGEVLQLELAGDLSGGNAGVLIFVEGRKQPEYVRWAEINEIQFDRPPAMYPPLETR